MSKNHHDFFRIDNDGNGNCGYYALAMGIIQLSNQHQTNGPIDKWKALDPEFPGDLDLMIESCQWDELQLSLRRIVYNQIVIKYPQHYDEFIGCQPIEDLWDFVHNYEIRSFKYSWLWDGRNNPLADSRKVKSLVAAIREALTQIQYPQSPQLQNIAQHEFIVAALIKYREMILEAYHAYYIDSNSWATEQELSLLAECFGVRIVFYVNGCPSPGMGYLPQTPYVILNNENNRHWTLLIPKVSPVFARPPQEEKDESECAINQLNSNSDHQTQSQEDQKDAELMGMKTFVREEFAELLQNLSPIEPPKHRNTKQVLHKSPTQISYASYCLNAGVFSLFLSGVTIASAPQLVIEAMSILSLSQVSAVILILVTTCILATLITFITLKMSDSLTQALAS